MKYLSQNSDKTSLYTNLNFNEIKTAIQNTLTDHVNQEYDINRPSTESLLNILSILLTKKEFTFNENAYKQIVGVSMGGVASPELSDIAIFDHTNNIIEQYPYKDNIKFHKRMRDDGFFIFNGSSELIKQLFEIANKKHNLLKFTFKINTRT